jgi:hypothetical protein
MKHYGFPKTQLSQMKKKYLIGHGPGGWPSSGPPWNAAKRARPARYFKEAQAFVKQGRHAARQSAKLEIRATL